MAKSAIQIFLGVVGVFLYFYAITVSRDKNSLVICDVSQGSALIYTVKNIQVLIDVGPRYDLLVECLDKYIPSNDRKLEAIVLSHADSDHVGGIYRLTDRYEINKIFINKSMYYEKDFAYELGKISQSINLVSYDDELIIAD